MSSHFNITRTNLLVPSTSEPITLAETKAYLGITDTSQDTQITSWITSVRQLVELYTSMAIMPQTWQLFLNYLPSYHNSVANSIELPKSPLNSVTHIKHYDEDDVATIIPASEYQVSIYNGINPWEGRVTFKDSFNLPSITSLRNADPFEIEFVAGFADSGSVPEAIKTAIQQGIAAREDQQFGNPQSESVSGVYSANYGDINNRLRTSGLSAETEALLRPFKKIFI